MNRKTVKVFVYGTLKRDFSNNYLMEGSEFIKEVELNDYVMKNVNDSFPCITPCETWKVKGELWSVPIDVLAYNIDTLEGYNPYSLSNLYNRVVVSIEGEDCFTYEWGDKIEVLGFETVRGGQWTESDMNK